MRYTKGFPHSKVNGCCANTYKDKNIEKRLFEIEEFKNSKVICIYLSNSEEVNTENIIKESIRLNKKVCVPKSYSDGIMKMYYIDESTKYIVGKFNIKEPISSEEAFKNDIDLFIVPGVCFSIYKDRCGYGKGYYDRYLENTRGVKIGLCYDETITDIKFSYEKDILMDYVKTIDEGILKREIEKTKKQIKEEMDVAKKISLTEKLRNLKKKECK